MKGIVEALNSMVSCGKKEKVNCFIQSILMGGRNLVPVNTEVTPFILMWWLNCSGMRIWPHVTPEHSERKISYPGRQPAALVSVDLYSC